MDRDSSVGIATRYGLDAPGIESRWEGEIFRTGAHPTSYKTGTGSLRRVNRSGRGVEHPLHLAPRLKNSTVLTLLPLWILVACSKLNFKLEEINADHKANGHGMARKKNDQRNVDESMDRNLKLKLECSGRRERLVKNGR